MMQLVCDRLWATTSGSIMPLVSINLALRVRLESHWQRALRRSSSMTEAA
jgi:hypothetical protein